MHRCTKGLCKGLYSEMQLFHINIKYSYSYKENLTVTWLFLMFCFIQLRIKTLYGGFNWFQHFIRKRPSSSSVCSPVMSQNFLQQAWFIILMWVLILFLHPCTKGKKFIILIRSCLCSYWHLSMYSGNCGTVVIETSFYLYLHLYK